MRAVCYSDGGARPTNPGYAAFAVVIYLDDNPEPKILSRYLGRRHTNNYAEYAGLIVGAKYAHHLGATEFEGRLDSKLVVMQVTKQWQVKRELILLCRLAQDVLDNRFPESWSLTHIPRAKNKQADSHCTNAANYGRAQNIWLPTKTREKLMRSGAVLDPFNCGPDRLLDVDYARTHA